VTEASAVDRIWSDHAGFPPPGERLFRRKPKFARGRGRDGRAAAGIDARRGCRDERLLRGTRAVAAAKAERAAVGFGSGPLRLMIKGHNARYCATLPPSVVQKFSGAAQASITPQYKVFLASRKMAAVISSPLGSPIRVPAQ